jgi:hypothetical protein
MLTRRQLLNTVLAGSAAFAAGAGTAQAFTYQAMPPDVAAAYALGCGNSGDHGQLVQAARSALQGEIASGVMPAGAEQIVVCPICGCRMVVSADSSN